MADLDNPESASFETSTEGLIDLLREMLKGHDNVAILLDELEPEPHEGGCIAFRPGLITGAHTSPTRHQGDVVMMTDALPQLRVLAYIPILDGEGHVIGYRVTVELVINTPPANGQPWN